MCVWGGGGGGGGGGRSRPELMTSSPRADQVREEPLPGLREATLSMCSSPRSSRSIRGYLGKQKPWRRRGGDREGTRRVPGVLITCP